MGFSEICAWLRRPIFFHIGFFLSIVLGTKPNHSSWADGQALVDRTLATDHGAFTLLIVQFSTSGLLTNLLGASVTILGSPKSNLK